MHTAERHIQCKPTQLEVYDLSSYSPNQRNKTMTQKSRGDMQWFDISDYQSISFNFRMIGLF